MTQHKILYDTDPGVDDAMALVFQARHPDIALVGVTSVFGNATIDTTTRNALYLTSRFAPGVPVARGAAAPLRRAAPAPVAGIHGHDGLGDCLGNGLGDDLGNRAAGPLAALDPARHAGLDPRPAHRFIADTVRAHPHEITLVAVGPLTNLARVVLDAPDAVPLVRQVVIMGGAFGIDGVLGNVTPAAEANIHADPDAADLVLSAAWPLAVVGLDVTQRTIMSADYLAALRDDAGDAGRFVWNVSRHYHAFHRQSDGIDGIYTHDPSAVAYVLAPQLYTTRRGPVRVVTDGIAAGLTIQKPGAMTVSAPDWDGRPARQVCVDVDAAGVLELYRRTLVG